MNLTRFFVLTSIAVALSTAFVAPDYASAQQAEAREAFQRGVELYSAEQYQEALDAFGEAYRIAPHPSVRVNIANCYDQLGDPVNALRHFERFLEESAAIDPMQRADIEAAIRRLETQVGELVLEVTPEGTTIEFDDGTQLTAPILETVRIRAGERTLTFTSPLGETRQEMVDVAAQRESVVRISFADSDVVSADGSGNVGGGDTTLDEEEEDESSRSSKWVTPLIISSAATVAFGATATGFGISALRAESEFDDALATVQSPNSTPMEVAQARQDGESARDLANRNKVISDIFLGATVVSGVLAVTFLVLHLTSDDDGESARTHLSPVFGRNAAGLSFEQTF